MMDDFLPISMIPLRSETVGDPERIVATLREQWPECPPIRECSLEEGIGQIEFDSIIGNFAIMPAPMPWSELEGPCSTAIHWPEAEKQLRDHAAHLIVTVTDPGRDRIDGSMLLTRLTGALLPHTPAVGIYWGVAGLVHPPGLFLEEAREMTRDQLPLNLWIDFRIFKNEKGGLSAFTCGMTALGHREFEVDHATVNPAHLRDRLYNIAHYVLDRGPVLKDGETIGLSAEEKIRINHRPSDFGHEGTVLKLGF